MFSPGDPHFKYGAVNKNIMEAGCFRNRSGLLANRVIPKQSALCEKTNPGVCFVSGLFEKVNSQSS